MARIIRASAVQDAVAAVVALDVGLAGVDGDVVERPWGLLCYNLANPDHHDSNTARQIRAADPEPVILELTAFYRAHGLTPRVRCDSLTQPSDFVARLRAHGYTAAETTSRIMVWEGAPPREPRLPAGCVIERAGPRDLADVARAQAEGFGNDSDGWIRGFLVRELVHPAVRWYVGRVDGVAASTAAVFAAEGAGLVINVATVPAYRGRGLATAVLARAQAEAGRPLLLEVVEENAERIYRRNGFEPRGVLSQTACLLPWTAVDG